MTLVKSIVSSSETKREDVRNSHKWWAIGLIDGDGHIGLEWPKVSEKFKWVPCLKVSLHVCNARAIYKLKKILGVGRITHHKQTITLRVRSKRLWLSHLMPLFNHYKFRTNKYYDLLNVKKAFHTENNLGSEYKIKALNNLQKNCRRQAKSYKGRLSPIWPRIFNLSDHLSKDSQIEALSNLIDNCDWAVLKRCLDFDWLGGFIEAEGSFYILSNGQHGFALGQAHNLGLIIAIHRLFRIRSKLKVRPNYLMLDTKNKAELLLIGKIVDHRLLGIKSFIFSLWIRTLRKKDRNKSLKAKHIISRIRSRLI